MFNVFLRCLDEDGDSCGVCLEKCLVFHIASCKDSLLGGYSISLIT